MRRSVLVISFIIALTACAGSNLSDNTGHTSSSGAMGMPVRDVSGFGIVTQVSVEDSVINISHGPMPEMNWAPMLMSFNVAGSVDLKPFKAGDKVQFVLEVDKNKHYRIKELSPTIN